MTTLRLFPLPFLLFGLNVLAPSQTTSLFDKETGTQFQITPLGGASPCQGYSGNLTVIGEVPAKTALDNDTLAKALVATAKATAIRACPRFHLGVGGLEIQLFTGNYSNRRADIYVFWQQVGYSQGKEAITRDPTIYENRLLEPEVTLALPNKALLFLLGTDADTGAKFWIYSQEPTTKCWHYSGNQFKLFGVVPRTVSLLDDKIGDHLIQVGASLALRRCTGIQHGFAEMFLVPEGYSVENNGLGPTLLTADISGGYMGRDWPKVGNINNYVVREEQAGLQRAREEKNRVEVRTRYDQFVNKHGVKKWPTIQELTTNPFVYEGVIIAINSRFEEMTSATQGVFTCRVGSRDHPFVVSGIPKGALTKKVPVVLAGRVLGKMELKAVFGRQMVLHLSFVGVYFCAHWGCSDIIPK
jgi:hypothetical protein